MRTSTLFYPLSFYLFAILFSFTAAAPTPSPQHDNSTSSPPPSTSECAVAFSCPPVDEQGFYLVLGVKDAVSPSSEMGYSFFECVYAEPALVPQGSAGEGRGRMRYSCNYYKSTGAHALGSSRDHCPPTAVPCTASSPAPLVSSSSSTSSTRTESAPASTSSDSQPLASRPLFSGQDESGKDVHVQRPPWVELGREMMWLKNHHQLDA